MSVGAMKRREPVAGSREPERVQLARLRRANVLFRSPVTGYRFPATGLFA